MRVSYLLLSTAVKITCYMACYTFSESLWQIQCSGSNDHAKKIIFILLFGTENLRKWLKIVNFNKNQHIFSTKSTLNMSCYTFMKCLIQKQSNIGNYTIKNKFFFSFWYWNLQKWLKIVNFNKNQHIFPTKSTQSMTCRTFLKYLRLKQCNNGNYTVTKRVFVSFWYWKPPKMDQNSFFSTKINTYF